MPTVTEAWDGHLLLLASAHDVASGCAAWAARGVARREVMLYVADEAHSDVAGLTSALAACGVDVDDTGLLQVVAPHEFYLDGGAVRMVDEARRQGRAGIRVFSNSGAADALLSPVEADAFERRLASWTPFGVTSVCRYEPDALTDPTDLQEAFNRHESGWGDPLLRAHRSGRDRLVLEGEADATNEAVLSTMIRTAGADAPTNLTVDCFGLMFVSVGAWRAAAAAGREVSAHATAVELAGLSRTQLDTLHRLGLDRSFVLGGTGGHDA